MKFIELPDGEQKPAWPAIFGGVPLIYLFFEPYQRQAQWPEWFATSLAFLVFAGLYLAAIIYWARPKIVLRVCIAMAMLAIVFSAYRPGGVLFFIYVAAIGPIAVGGNIPKSAAIILGAMLATIVEWSLLWPFSYFPYITAAEALLIGCSTTFIARHHVAMKRAVKTVERERIARDLHDVLGHTLSVIILKSELAGRLMDRNPERARVEIGEIERIARKSLSEVREAIVGYRAGDLLSEIERVAEVLATAGIELEWRIAAVALPDSHQRVLALALREAITNIVRHSRAKTCRIALDATPNAVEMRIDDDGVGGPLQEGMGMRGIRERLAALGGKAIWNEKPQGTEVIIRAPLAQAEAYA